MKKLLLSLIFLFGISLKPKASCIIWYNCGTNVCGSYQANMNCDTWDGTSCLNVNNCYCQQLAPVIAGGGGVKIAHLNDQQGIMIYSGGEISFSSNGLEYVLFDIDTYYPSTENNIGLKVENFNKDEFKIDLIEQNWTGTAWETISSQVITKDLKKLKNLYPSPNPAINTVTITDNGKEIGSGDVAVILYSQSLEQSYSFDNIKENNYSFSVSELPIGVYIYNIILEGTVQFGGQIQINH